MIQHLNARRRVVDAPLTARRPAERRETSAVMPDKLAILGDLSVAAAAFDAARRSLADEVERARQAGASWSEIGQALG